MTSNEPLKFCAMAQNFKECLSNEKSAYRTKYSAERSPIDSCDKLCLMLQKEISVEIFQADCTKNLPQIYPDIIITDVPYGNLVEWKEASLLNLEEMMSRLWEISHEGTVLAICMDKKQKIQSEKWIRIEKNNIGKRRLEIYVKGRV